MNEVLVPLLVALISSWIAYRVGYRNATIAAKTLDLNIRKATPKLGSTVKIVSKKKASHVLESYYLVVTVYNEGELPAKQLDGKCRLFSPIEEIQQADLPISRDFLGASPYELEHRRIVGATVITAMRGQQTISMNVDIDFQYFGLDEDKPLDYAAKYKYDDHSHEFVKIP